MNDRERTSPLQLLVNGFLVTVPVLLLAWFFVVVFRSLAGWVQPLFDALPGKIIQTAVVRDSLLVVVIAALFVAIGAIARTRRGHVMGRRMELALLSRLPFYNALRMMTSGAMIGQRRGLSLGVVLVTVDVPGLQQLGFVLELHPDGNRTVYLPSSPNPGSGTVVVVEPARVRELDVRPAQVLWALGQWGHGTARLLADHAKEQASGSGTVDPPQADRKGDA